MGKKKAGAAAKAKREKMHIAETASASPDWHKNIIEASDSQNDNDAVMEAVELAYGQIDEREDADVVWEGGGRVSPIPEKPKKWRVTIITDTKITLPELYLDVYLAPGENEAAFAEMFVRTGSMRANSIDQADLVVFSGGPDVDPGYYGVTDYHKTTRVSDERDYADLMLYIDCYEKGIPMFGVCRGAQLLWTQNGGQLFQDVDNHNRAHPIYDCIQNRYIQPASSTHHQACIYDKKRVAATILATADVSRNRWFSSIEKDAPGAIKDVEAYFIRETCCLGVQGHPEYRGYPEYTAWCMDQIQRHIIENPDIEFSRDVDGHRRIKPELLELRSSGLVGSVSDA